MNKKLSKAIKELEKEEPFFIDLLDNLELVEKKEAGTMGTDGTHLFYNPAWLEKISAEETKGVLIHEILHCVFLHLYRKKKKEHLKWNIATDLAINPLIKVDYGYQLPKGVLLKRKYYGLSAETIYDMLPKSKRKQQGWGNHKYWKNQQKKGQGGLLEKIKEKLQGKKKTQGKPKKSKKEWEKNIKDALNRHRGDLPDTLLRKLEEFIFIPETNWKDLLKYYLSASDKDYTFSVRDRRFLESDFILPGTYSQDDLKDVVVAYDSSGSIQPQTLTKFYEEFKSLLEAFPNLNGYYIVCDAKVQDFGRIEKTETLPRFIGGGGTDHSPVFEEVKKRGLNPKLLIAFTDLETLFPEQEPDYPVLWLVPCEAGYDYEVEVPFGDVVKIWKP